MVPRRNVLWEEAIAPKDSEARRNGPKIKGRGAAKAVQQTKPRRAAPKDFEARRNGLKIKARDGAPAMEKLL